MESNIVVCSSVFDLIYDLWFLTWYCSWVCVCVFCLFFLKLKWTEMVVFRFQLLTWYVISVLNSFSFFSSFFFFFFFKSGQLLSFHCVWNLCRLFAGKFMIDYSLLRHQIYDWLLLRHQIYDWLFLPVSSDLACYQHEYQWLNWKSSTVTVTTL